MLYATALVVVLLIAHPAPSVAQWSSSPESVFAPTVSPIHLIARPEAYHEKRVRVTGYLHVRFEDSALYLSKDDADYLRGENGVWVTYDPGRKMYSLDRSLRTIDDIKYFDERYVILEGVFDMKERGHMGAFSGCLKDVVVVLEKRRWYDGRKQLVK